MPVGDTANRPGNPITGLIRFNTDSSTMEYFDGSTYQPIGSANSISYLDDNFVGNGVQVAFNMNLPATSAHQLLVFINSLYQPPSNYTVSGTTQIVFATPPPNGAPINVLHSIA